MSKINVCCIFGGVSTEHKVSLSSATTVLTNIDREKYEPIMLGITTSGRWLLYRGPVENIATGEWERGDEFLTEAWIFPSRNEKCIYTADGEKLPVDVVFPAVHGTNCEDGTLQGLLTLSGIPYVGSDCESSAICMDKAATKTILQTCNIPMAKAVVATRTEIKSDIKNLIAKCESLEYPMFVKPARTGSSIGVFKVRSGDELADALSEACVFDKKVLVEEYIRGAEIEVAVMGNEEPQASICGEIDPGSDFYDYDTKYVNDRASYYIPARIDEKSSDKAREYALEIYKTLGCRGLARIDFFVGERIIFNEINTLPGFTSISMFPRLFMHSGMTISDIIDRLITLALAQNN